MRSHFSINGGAAATCALSGAVAMLTGVCSAQLAADYATDPAYSGGWLAGQNGGYGFGPWSFNGGSGSPIQQRMTYGNSSPFNALGTAWTLFNPVGAPSDVANAGRSFAPLQVGQTIETVIDNPTATQFYRGYTITLNDTADNIPAGGNTGQQVSAYTFEYFTNGRWYVGDSSGNHSTSLFNTDTAPKGMQFAVTLTSPTTYQMTMTPLNNPANAYTINGALKLPGNPIDWIQFQFYNTADNPAASTDFYISSIEILAAPEPSTSALIALGAGGLLFFCRRK